VRTFLITYAAMVVIAAILGRVAGTPSLFELPPTRVALAGGCAAGLGIGLAIVLAGVRLERVAWYRRMALRLREAVVRLLGPDLRRPAFVVALYSSVGEEALFRGVLQPWLISCAGGVLPPAAAAVAGVVGASLVFALSHLAPGVDELRPWPAFAVVVGLLLGGLTVCAGSLLPAVLAHVVINWLNLRRLAAMTEDGA
jgi:membrane protease YdiL (CAAX protease family)